MSYCRVLSPGEFSGMSSENHVSHCSVLPLGEFTVMIPESHATLQGAEYIKIFPLGGVQGANWIYTGFLHFSGISEEVIDRFR